MVAGLLQYVSNHIDTIMTGLTMAVVGISVYEARDGFFRFLGKFRGKYVALVVFVGALFGSSLITPMVSDWWARSLPSIPPGQLLGAILVLGMLGVNKAAEWNFFDIKSLPVYGVGVVLIANPEVLYTVA
jgi:cytochrome b subunit of formate dehydrogenase